MSASAATPQDPPSTDETPDPSVTLAEWRLRLLEELAEMGMELARALNPGATVGAEPPSDDKSPAKLRDPAEAFWSVSRAVRLTLALHARTDQELRDLKAGVVRDREAEKARAAERAAKAREGREAGIVGLVERVALAECETIEDLRNIHDALRERLDEDEAYWDIDKRPVRETLERLCKDLTLTPDWSRWDGEGWIDDGPPARARFSVFNTPSARPRRCDEDGRRLQTPAPPWRLHSDREPAVPEPVAHALE
ncbi:MAG: hypothetical protein ACREEB_05010 [Caulobacteraceae bacterium]